LIFDEVQTGFGRTGTMFAWQHYGIKPDIMTVAKAIAGGIPMGAILCSNKINVPSKLHANTFGGYPLTCAAALATITMIEKQKLLEKSTERGAYFVDKLKQIDSPKIREVRGMGLMIAVELKEAAGPYVQPMTDQGILVLLTGRNAIRFLPPLVISKEQIDTVVGAFGKVLAMDV
jgi:LysW-gamma-L-lysine/LysW-L-ornithine aminotransferase